MSFSMPSYFLGVGTVVGALALGFGGGVVLTQTAIKETPTAPTRVERVARAEPLSNASSGALSNVSSNTPKIAEAAAAPAPRAEPSANQSAPEPVPQVQAAVEPAAVAREESPKAAEPVRQADAPKQAEQREAEQRKAAERKAERQKRYAERKARAMASARIVRQRPVEEQEQLARPQLAFEREEPRSNPLEGLFGRTIEPADSRD